jgi:MATE family multidrug resistance protein
VPAQQERAVLHRFIEPGLSARVWAIALPAMLTNVATALFGLVDMIVIGQTGTALDQAAVELGAKFMMGALTTFIFLRMGLVCLTAQALGRGDVAGAVAALVRALAFALLVALLLMAVMPVAVPYGVGALGAEGALAERARVYIDLRAWSIAAWLVNIVLIGWLIGHRRMRTVLVIEVAANIFHIALDILFVVGLDGGVRGVAAATLLSEWAKFVALAAVVHAMIGRDVALAALRAQETWHMAAIVAMLRMHRDLFLRTLLLIGSALALTRVGAEAGVTQLAANGIVFQVFAFSALLLDGFESAGQVLCGDATGRRDRAMFGAAVGGAFTYAGVTALMLAALFLLAGGEAIGRMFSRDAAVIAAVGLLQPWIVLLPLAGFASFVLDGVFIGAGWSRAMLATMAAAVGCFAVALLIGGGGPYGPWPAFILFLIARGAGQLWLLPRLLDRHIGT